MWAKLLAWHMAQYEKGNGEADWADKCLELMEETEKEMGLYAPLRKPEDMPKKPSIFDKIMEGKQ
jgi:hypothetical protein